MATHSALLSFWRRKATWFALVVGAATAVTSAWLMPYAPWRSLLVPQIRWAEFSPDFHYAAVSGMKREDNWTLYDLTNGRALFSFPATPYVSDLMISRDNLLAWLEKHKARFRRIPSGEQWEWESDTILPASRELQRDADGRLLVVVKDDSGYSVRDLLSGKEVGTLPGDVDLLPGGCWPGGCLHRTQDHKKIEVRELPTGQLRGELEFGELRSSTYGRLTPDPDWALSPDCKIAAMVSAGKVHVWDVRTGKRNQLDVPADHVCLNERFAPALSTNGSHLVFRVNRPPRTNPPWLDWVLARVGHVPRKGPELVLYDLTANREIASFEDTTADPDEDPYIGRATFSLDGKSLAIAQGDTLDIYDFPLHRPWLRIAGYALTASVIAWVLVYLLGRRFARKR
jgi:hypothetical protein